jgi:hypothetical protein
LIFGANLLLWRANLLLERAKADVRKVPRSALRLGHARRLRPPPAAAPALTRAGGHAVFLGGAVLAVMDRLGPGRQVRLPAPPVVDDPQFCAQIATLGLDALGVRLASNGGAKAGIAGGLNWAQACEESALVGASKPKMKAPGSASARSGR